MTTNTETPIDRILATLTTLGFDAKASRHPWGGCTEITPSGVVGREDAWICAAKAACEAHAEGKWHGPRWFRNLADRRCFEAKILVQDAK